MLWQTLLMSGPLSILLMATTQKMKQLPFVKDDLCIWVTNLCLAFVLGFPYYFLFFAEVSKFGDITLYDGLIAFWVSFLSFIGAPAIYSSLKEQNLINRKPRTLREIKEQATFINEAVATNYEQTASSEEIAAYDAPILGEER